MKLRSVAGCLGWGLFDFTVQLEELTGTTLKYGTLNPPKG